MFTLGQAAKAAGVSKTTISKAIATGRISAGRNDKGVYQIQPAELFRVYTKTGEPDGTRNRDKTPTGGQTVDPEMMTENASLKAKVDGLEAMINQLREQASDLKEQRDGWQKQAEGSQRLLADQRPQRRGWFGLGKAS